jgi:uncharacterized membrane protein HdeD (DUF308 family)
MKLTMSHAAAMLVVGALLFVFGVMAGQWESELPPPVPPGVFTALGFVAIVAGLAFIGVARKNRGQPQRYLEAQERMVIGETGP